MNQADAIMNEGGLSREQVYWSCRRGMLELDLLLQGFFQKCWDGLDVNTRLQFVRLLEYPDAVLFELLMGHAITANAEIAGVIEQIRANT